jgi:hypothetical protein
VVVSGTPFTATQPDYRLKVNKNRKKERKRGKKMKNTRKINK